MSLRRDLEHRSGPALVVVGRLPTAVPFVVVLALLLGGLALHGPVGALLLLALAAVVGWITYLAWPALQPGARGLRALVLALLLVAAVSRH